MPPLDETPATGAESPGFFDLIKGLRGPQWAQLAGATFGGLNVGSPRNPFYPLQGVGALGTLLEQQRQKQQRAAMIGPLLNQVPPEVRGLAGPLYTEGDLSGADLINLITTQTGRTRQQQAAGATRELFAPQPDQSLTLEPGQEAPPEAAMYSEQARTDDTTTRLPGAMTSAEMARRLGLVPPDLLPDVMRHAGTSPAQYPGADPNAEKARGFFALYRQVYPPREAAQRAAAAVRAGLTPAQVEQDVRPQLLNVPHRGVVAVSPSAVQPGQVVPGTEAVPRVTPHISRSTDAQGHVHETTVTTDDAGRVLDRKTVDLGAIGKPSRATGQPTETSTTRTTPRKQVTNPERVAAYQEAMPDVVNDLTGRVPGFAAPNTGTVDVPGLGKVAKTKLIERAFLKQYGIEVTVRWDGRRFRVVQAWEPEHVSETTSRKGPARERDDAESE